MRLFRRILGDGEDPTAWGWVVARLPTRLPTQRGRGPSHTDLRLHPILPAYVLVQLAWSLPPDRLGLPYVASLLAGLLLTMGVREAVRWILTPVKPPALTIWPLGLIHPRSQQSAAADVAAWFAGLAIALGAVVACLAQGVPMQALDPTSLRTGVLLLAGFPEVLAWSVFVSAGGLSLLHLLPIPPLDASRFMRGGTSFAAAVSACVVVAIGSVVFEATLLLAVAIVGLWLAYRGSRDAAFLANPGDDAWLTEPPAPPGPEEVDRVLAKVSAQGLDALTAHERRVLRMASDTLQRPN